MIKLQDRELVSHPCLGSTVPGLLVKIDPSTRIGVWMGGYWARDLYTLALITPDNRYHLATPATVGIENVDGLDNTVHLKVSI